MPVTVKRLPNEPILIATFSGRVVPDDIVELYSQSAALMGAQPGTFHRITDTRAIEEGGFADLMKNLQVATQELPASLMNKQMHVTFVGSSNTLYSARDYFLKRGVPTAAFDDMDTALQSVRIRIAAEKNQPPTPV